jgi:O-acetyl-ADP-ribose deacetylase (regulator of RNase III)
VITIAPHGSSIFHSATSMIVIPVNCVGVMGAGLAKEYANRYPEGCEAYRKACKLNALVNGRAYRFGRKTIFATTKYHWSKPSRKEWVESCLMDILAISALADDDSVAIPALGCGLGCLDWEWFKTAADRLLGSSKAQFLLHPPH